MGYNVQVFLLYDHWVLVLPCWFLVVECIFALALTHLFLHLVKAVSLLPDPILIVSVCVSGIPSDWELQLLSFFRELLLLFSVQLLSVSQEAGEVSGHGWVLAWSGTCRLQDLTHVRCCSSLPSGDLPADWLVKLSKWGEGPKNFAPGPKV